MTNPIESNYPALRILKVASCPTASGKGTLTYHVGCNASNAIQFRVVQNSGGVADVVLAKVMDLDLRHGYNAYTDQYGDMMQMGIIDPIRVVRCALKNAASAAGMMLTAGCAIIDDL